MEKEKVFKIPQAQVLEAYKRVKKNHGAGGIDGVNFEDYEKDLKNNLYKLWNRMSSGSYFPKAVRGVEIPKKNGKKRLLGIPTIEDRVAQMTVRMSFEGKVEKLFYKDSYGYRPGKSALDAVGSARKRCWEYDWVLEYDITGLFDNINHGFMMEAVKAHVEEAWIKLYIERFLKAPIMLPDGEEKERRSGTPQGGVISPVLANLFMHYVFDKWISIRYPGNPWERYADDGIIHCRSKQQAYYLLEKLKERMGECGLEINEEKTRIVYCGQGNRGKGEENTEFKFLGYTFQCRLCRAKNGKYFRGFTPAVSKEASKGIREKCREIRLREKTATPEELAKVINPIIRGWLNYFTKYSPSEAKKVMRTLNETLVLWFRRRYKNLRQSKKKARIAMYKWHMARPDLFYHWKIGVVPTPG